MSFAIAFHPCYEHPLPEGHRFPMEKYAMLPEMLIWEGTIDESQLFAPTEIKEEVLRLCHSVEYIEKLNAGNLSKAEIRATGFPYSKELIRRERVITQGSAEGAIKAMTDGIGFNIAGGTHHSFSDRGEGFCLYNDIAVAASNLLNEGLAQKILVIDLDVHQGNGTAKIFESENRVFTFSMHGEKNYPMRKEESDLDIGLPDGIGTDAYLSILHNTLPKLIDSVEPDFIFYQSGVDILESDKLGRLKVSIEGCKNRDEFVIGTAHRHKIPIFCSMGGGYSPNIKDIIEAHANTYRVAANLYY